MSFQSTDSYVENVSLTCDCGAELKVTIVRQPDFNVNDVFNCPECNKEHTIRASIPVLAENVKLIKHRTDGKKGHASQWIFLAFTALKCTMKLQPFNLFSGVGDLQTIPYDCTGNKLKGGLSICFVIFLLRLIQNHSKLAPAAGLFFLFRSSSFFRLFCCFFF